MTPYVDFSYFLLLLYPLAVLVVLGVAGRLGRSVVLLVSLGLVLFQYGDPLGAADLAGLQQLIFLAAYAAASIAIVQAYAAARRREAGQPAFYVAVGLVLAPLVAVKAYPLVAAHGLAHASPPGAPGSTRRLPGVPGMASGFFDTVGFLGMSYM